MNEKSNCTDCLSNKDSIFNVLKEKEIELLENNSTYKFYKKSKVIYKEGNAPNGLVCLCSGKVKIFKEGVGRRDQIIRMCNPIDFIGFRALFANDTYIASAVAIEDCSICVVEKHILEKLVRSNSDFSLLIIKKLAMELGVSNQRTVSLTQKHIRGRLAESLLFLIKTYGYENKNKIIKVYLSREDLANLSNMTTSNAIRTLSGFAAEEVIGIDGRRISILNLKELEKISVLG